MLMDICIAVRFKYMLINIMIRTNMFIKRRSLMVDTVIIQIVTLNTVKDMMKIVMKRVKKIMITTLKVMKSLIKMCQLVMSKIV